MVSLNSRYCLRTSSFALSEFALRMVSPCHSRLANPTLDFSHYLEGLGAHGAVLINTQVDGHGPTVIITVTDVLA